MVDVDFQPVRHPPEPSGSSPTFWLDWLAHNTPPPAAAPDACGFERAVSIAERIARPHWRVRVEHVLDRWRLTWTTPHGSSLDYTGPISAERLRRYLLPRQPADRDDMISVERAIEIAHEYAPDGLVMRPWNSRWTRDGRLWSIIAATPSCDGTYPDAALRRLAMPDPGYTDMLEGGWVVTTELGMTEPIWRLTLEIWKQAIVDARG